MLEKVKLVLAVLTLGVFARLPKAVLLRHVAPFMDVIVTFVVAVVLLVRVGRCDLTAACVTLSPLLLLSKSLLGFDREPWPLEMHHALYDEAALDPPRPIIDCILLQA